MEITTEELKRKIENGEKLVIDFHAAFCVPCRQMKPIFERIATEYKEQNSDVQLYTMDVEANMAFAKSLGIRNIPMIKTFANGTETYSRVGTHTEEEIKNVIETV
jgi:thioredoxin-like negative regulator of GroEL